MLYNPVAGAGRAKAAAEGLSPALLAAGHRVELLPTQRGIDSRWLESPLHGADLLVVVGGDGAVRLASEPASRRGVALWQCPLGTENLFAREWGMSRGAPALLQAIRERRVVESDLGDANGEPFTLMASAGLDADVVHDLASHRRGGISHLSYLGPILRCLWAHRPRSLRVTVDGERVDRSAPGFVVVGNSRQYALGMNPALHAIADDRELDVAWFPAAGVASLVAWMVRLAIGRLARGRLAGDSRVVHRRGRAVLIEAEEPFLYQLDGDPPTASPAGSAVVRLAVALRPSRLRVLTGAGWRPNEPAP